MSYEVSVVKCETYDEAEVRKAVEEGLAPLGGLGSVVKKGDRVLIKLNLLAAKPPEAAVTTHPALAKAVVNMIKELGAIPMVGDSPGGRSTMTSYKALLKATGIQQMADETGCAIVRFDGEVADTNAESARTYKKLKIAKAVTEAEVIISLPKMKTHTLTYFTGAVKMLYGYLPGMTKAEYHLHTARDVGMFAELLLDLYEARRPDLSIMDAIVGMEGAGPQHGSPRRIGLVMASKSCTALDYVAATIAGFDPMSVPTIKKAYERNIGPADLKDIQVYGEKVEPLIIKDFKKPHTMQLNRIPPFLLNSLRRFVSDRPCIDPAKCRMCGACARECPPKAIRFVKGKIPSIDHNKCIRCYCCQELCPEGAVYVSRPFARRLIKNK
ncbi:DUF362 domain-containing protein [Methanocella conradii]|uniref:DUF362 domain-containing protein n=1 Tax=Methanocella conradii TaxID=1175444 RepID=UPI00157C2194|nr:DUF362 domain-containing protein [Methanocella conradii]